MIERIKGTQDFIDLSLFNFVIKQCKKHLALYHFAEIATPIIEPTELFKRSLGLQTDVVSKEMFTIASRTDENEESICLRPEATAAIVRAFIENGIQTTPWNVFTWGPMFRYERPQKGRYRQFHQVSMEQIGVNSISYDVRFIKMLDRFFHEVLSLNNYALMLNFLGCLEDRTEYKKILKEFLESESARGICQLCTERKEKNILRIFDCKNEQCQEIYKHAPRLIDYLCTTCAHQWVQVQEQLDLLSVTYTWNPSLVRGLDYYNKTVFEFVSAQLGAQSTFCAGGRYDTLISQLGGKVDQPSFGAAIGIERLMLLLEPLRESLQLEQPPALHVIMPLSQEQQTLALLVADNLEAHGLCVDILLDSDSVKSMMRKANKMGAAYSILIGQEEQQNHTVAVKNMITGTEDKVQQSELKGYLTR